MKATVFFLMVVGLPAIFAGGALGQSGRERPFSGIPKANSRPADPSPTPLPTPAAKTSPDPTADTAASADDGEVIKVNTQLVSIPVRVMDKKGRFIAGLAKENFKVFEDGVEYEVAMFSNEHQPFTVALVLDMSYSATFKISDIQNAAIAFIDQLRPQDKVMVISFDEDVHVLCDATDDRKAIYGAIKSTKIATGTSLYEAMDVVMNRKLRAIEGRKAIILFTDGVDTTSRRSNDLRNLRDAMELDSLIYPIRYDTFADVQRMRDGKTRLPGNSNPSQIPTSPPIAFPGGNSIPMPGGIPIPLPVPVGSSPNQQGTTAEEYKKAEEYLDKLALRTGGRVYAAATFDNLEDAYAKIASELREFYSIGYYPGQERTGNDRAQVRVKVDQPGLVVKARDEYAHRKTKPTDR